MTVATTKFINLVVLGMLADLCQPMIKTEREATCLRAGEVVATNAGIEPFHAVQDQTIDRVAGSKRQPAKNVVIQISKRIGVIFDFTRGGEHL